LIIQCFTSCSRIFSFAWKRHHYRWRAAKFRPILRAQDFLAGRDIYCASPSVTRGVGFSCLIRRTAPHVPELYKIVKDISHMNLTLDLTFEWQK
jgi:hypothetical protein